MTMPRSVMVTAIGSVTGLAVVRALRSSDPSLRIFGTDAQGPGLVAGAQFVDEFSTLPLAGDEQYGSALLDLVRRFSPDFLIPIVDHEVQRVSDLQEDLRRLGTGTLLSSPDVVALCNSKFACARALAAASIETPVTTRGTEVDVAAATFPVYVKPDDGFGSRSTHRATTPAELATYLRITPGAVVQPEVTGVEHTVELLLDRTHRCIASVTRVRLETKQGVATKSRTVDEPAVHSLALSAAAALGLVGACNIQIVLGPSGPSVIDVNPRFAAGQPLGAAAGVDIPGMLLRLAAGEEMDSPPLQAKPGVTMLRYWQEVFVDEQ